jgi:exosome complex component RRP41
MAGVPVFDYVCAVSAGVHSTNALLDLTTLEENDVPHLTAAVLPRTGKVTLVTLETRLHADRFEELFHLACDAGKVLHKEMRRAVKNRTSVLIGAMGTVTGTNDAAQREADDNDMRDD